MRDLKQYENIIINILGVDIYLIIINKLNEILKKAEIYDLIVLITRKALGLFKVFEPLLDEELLKKHYNKIITDKVIITYKDIFKKSNLNLLIIDDTILYGRSVGEFIVMLQDKYQVPFEAINILPITLNIELLDNYHNNELPLSVSLNDKILSYNKNLNGTIYKAKLNDTLLIRRDNIIRYYSKIFLHAIHAVSAPYTAFSPHFYLDWDKITYFFKNGLIDFNNVSENFKKLEIYDITIEEQRKNDILTICAVTNDCTTNTYSSIRFYFNKKLKIILVIFLTIPPSINNIINIYDEFFHNLNKKGENDVSEIIKVRRFRYSISYIYGLRYLKENDLFINLMKEIHINYPSGFLIESNSLYKFLNIYVNDNNNFTDLINCISENIITDITGIIGYSKIEIDASDYNALTKLILEEIILDDPKNLKVRDNGKLVDELISKSSDKMKAFLNIIKICETGNASSYSLYIDGYNICYIRPGELAIDVINDYYHKCIPCMISILSFANRNKSQNEINNIKKEMEDLIKKYNIHIYKKDFNEEYFKFLCKTNYKIFDLMDTKKITIKQNNEKTFLYSFENLFKQYINQNTYSNFIDFIEGIKNKKNKKYIKLIKKYLN